MAVTVAPLGGMTSVLKIIHDTDLDETSDNNLADGAAVIYSITVDNSANGAASYFKAYNNAAPSVGTTAPDVVLLIPASKVRTFTFVGGLAAFPTALSIACVTAGGTGGVTGPTSAVLCSIVAA